MTDSEIDTSNVFTLQNANTTVSAKGPNTNITNFSFRNQLTSTMYMPRNFERQRYAESAYDQRSMYYRRETSPMSIHSACDMRPRNFQPYYRGMSSQQSVFNGRSGSPMSMRSIDSTASVSAADIAFAFKNAEFNKYDLKVIKEAYHKLMKQRVRKRIERRRNLRLFRKGIKKRPGGDSGEQGSNSSISSDDCRSVKTSYKENMSSSKSAVIPLSDFRNTVRDSNMPINCPNPNFKQNTFKNMFTVGSANVNNTLNFNNTMMSKQSNPIPTQKDRFKNGFLLPSQRFNRSVASSIILESSEKPYRNIEKNVRNSNVQNKHNKNNNGGSDSDEEEIFSEMTVREKSNFNIEFPRKRSLDSEDDSHLPDKKRSKLSSPTKNAPRNMKAPSKPKNIDASNNNNLRFEFAKPSLPVRKSKQNQRVQEKLIAKSAQPLIDFIEPIPKNIQESTHTLQPTNKETSNNNQIELKQSETTQNSDVSMRPSFIKRKLFTQRLDVAEKANLSSDGTSSPHSNVYTLQKEKNKARKLVTNQSCLNRDVQEDNNLLDLIHKIVPAERMNITNQSSINQTKTEVNNKNKTDNEEKWDITSVISMCNEDDISDTYTDEEIFDEVNTKEVKKIKTNYSNADPKPTEKVSNNVLLLRECKIVVENMQNNALQKHNNKNINLIHNNISKNNVKNSAKSFWDTDFESDAECPTVIPSRHVIENLKKANATLEATKQDFKNSAGSARSQVSKKSLPIPDNAKQLNNTINNTVMNNTVMNNTLDTTRKFNMSTLSVRSHRTTTKKKSCNETCIQDKTLKPDNRRKMLAETDKTTEQSKKCAVKQKSDVQSCKVLEPAKSTTNTQNEKKSRSTSNTRPKSPKEKTSKRVETPKNKEKPKSKSKVEKSSSVSKKPQSHNKNSKNKENIPSDKNNLKTITQPDKANKKDEQHEPSSNKLNTKTDVQNSKKNNSVSKPSKSKLNNSVVIKTDRPVRSCRASSQNRSIEVSSFNLNDSSENYKSLRSRNINLSSLMENITVKSKPGSKTVNNKNISHIITRISDVSFSLDTQRPMPTKNLAKKREHFFKGKRKT